MMTMTAAVRARLAARYKNKSGSYAFFDIVGKFSHSNMLNNPGFRRNVLAREEALLTHFSTADTIRRQAYFQEGRSPTMQCADVA